MRSGWCAGPNRRAEPTVPPDLRFVAFRTGDRVCRFGRAGEETPGLAGWQGAGVRHQGFRGDGRPGGGSGGAEAAGVATVRLRKP